MNAGEKDRLYFEAQMQKIAVGAKLKRRLVWTIAKQKRYDTSADLTLQRGRHSIIVHVPICHTGPCLSDIWMTAVAPAPSQRALFGGAAC